MYIESIWLSFSTCLSVAISMSCGIDNSPVPYVNVGIHRLETYPWLGVLYYPYSEYKFTTAVVLVTRQVVLAAASEIDKLPKHNFRAEARVTIGYNCSGPSIGVRDYTYHPDYSKDTYSTLALIQLETDHFSKELRPICPPPSHFIDQNFFALVLSDNCKQSQMRIHEMKYVSPQECKTFYRRTGLGFGVYGPGCQAPARFLDYGMHHPWVRRSITRTGRPAITPVEDNHIIIRKTSGNIQRFGPCDSEEMGQELYTENTEVTALKRIVTINHNLKLEASIEYSCVVIKADYIKKLVVKKRQEKPIIRVRRWCSQDNEMCPGLALLDIDIILEIKFKDSLNIQVTAYSKDTEYIEPQKILKNLNENAELANIKNYRETNNDFQQLLGNETYPSYGSGAFGPEN